MNTQALKHSVTALVFTLLTLVSTLPSFAQSCTYTVQPGQYLVDAVAANIKPGSVVCIPAGTRGSITFKNFVGTATNPIIIKNTGGKAIIKTTGSYGIKFQNSKFFKITGTGAAGTEYGIEIDGPHLGLTLEALSSNFEVDHLKIMNTGAMGVSAKTDPTCDRATWKGNFTMRDVKFHHNLVERTGSEAFYIGSSHYTTGVVKTCNGVSTRLWEHSLENVKVYNNITRATGRDGIQVGGAISQTEIYDNLVDGYGTKLVDGHLSGIQINPGTIAKTYNNTIKGGNGYGIFVTGNGGNIIYNNIVISPKTGGIFCDDRGTTPGTKFTFVNNTIINPGTHGIRMYSRVTTGNIFNNNIVVNPGVSYVDKMSGVSMIEANNLYTKDINSVKFANVSTQDYRLQSSSPAVDKGMNASGYGVTSDIARLARPSGTSHDIGSHEFQGTSTTTSTITANAGAAKTITLPTNSVVLNGSGTGTITSYAWSKVSGPAATLTNTTTANLTVTNMLAGTYTFRLTVKNSSNVTATSNVTVTVNSSATQTNLSGAIRINCGGSSFTTSTGQVFMADKYFSTGSATYTNNNISTIRNTTSHSLYKSERSSSVTLGNFKYNIPVANGTYTVKLHFAEIWFGATGGAKGGSGLRKMNVKLEGVSKLSNYDIYATSGTMAAVVKTYTVTVQDGNVTIDLGASVNKAKISAIEVLPQSTTLTSAALSDSEDTQISTDSETDKISAYPNPFIDNVTVDFAEIINDNVTIHIFDQLGRLVHESNQSVGGGESQVTINLNATNMTPGLYIMKVSVRDMGTKTIKLIKQ